MIWEHIKCGSLPGEGLCLVLHQNRTQNFYKRRRSSEYKHLIGQMYKLRQITLMDLTNALLPAAKQIFTFQLIVVY